MEEKTEDVNSAPPKDNASEGKETPPEKTETENNEAPPASPDVSGNSIPPTPGEGNENSPASEPNPIEEAKKTLASLEEQNKIMAENLKKAEKLSAEMMLSGRSMAGKEQTKEDIEIQQAKELLKGTGFDEQLFPEKKDE